MKRFIGVKLINAKPMTRLAYNQFRGWELPEDENGDDKGFLVEYVDGGKANTEEYEGYVSWSPEEVFVNAYTESTGLTFGMAIEALKKGLKVARSGWNGKGMFVVYQKGYPDGIPCNKQTADAWGLNEGDLFKCEPYLQLRMVNGSHSMWVPSINDVLSSDWSIV